MGTKINNNDDGNKLPETATSNYKLIGAGILTLLVGFFGIFTNRKKVNQ